MNHSSTKIYRTYFNSFVLIFLSIIHYDLNAETQLNFQQISQEQGLHSTAVYSTVEDTSGFMWFGTEMGLQRFDGREMKTFQHDPEKSNSLSHNYVRCLLIDDSGNVWAGTENGLNIINQKFESIDRFEYTLPQNDFLKANKIRALFKDKNGNIWIGSYFGLTRYDPVTGIQESFPHSIVRAIDYYDDENLIIGTLGDGFTLFNLKKRKFIELTLNSSFLKNKLANLVVTNIFILDSNRLLISTWGDGLIELNKKQSTIKQVDLGSRFTKIRSIIRESDKELWIGTNLGMLIYNEATNTKKYIRNLASYNSNEITTIRSFYRDKSNNIWIPTYGHGVFLFDPLSKQFNLYKVHIDKNEGLIDQSVYSFLELSDGDILIGSEGPLSRFNPVTKRFYHFTFTLNGTKFEEPIYQMHEIAPNKIVISFTNRSFIIDPSILNQELSSTNQSIFLRDIELIRSSQKKDDFIITWHNKKSIKILTLNEDGDLIVKSSFNFELTGNFASYHVDKYENLYIANNTGIVYKIINYKTSNPLVKKIRNKDNLWISGILTDNKNNVWLATVSAGLHLLKYQENLGYTEEKSYLSKSNIRAAIYNEKTNNIWITTDSGLLSMNLNTFKVDQFFKVDGLQSNEFIQSSALISKNFIYFGGVKGFNSFLPENIKRNSSTPTVLLTDFFLNGDKVKPSDNSIILNSAIHLTKKIKLRYNQNSFGFSFSTPNISMQRRISYEYQLIGYDSKPHQASNSQSHVNYTNIPPGEYIFTVWSTNKNNVSLKSNTKVDITISPPWWATKFAYFVYIVVIATSLYLIILFRTRALSIRSQNLEREVVERTKEVQQLLAQKNEEFANVSHEFRTPLSLILGPTAQLLKENQNHNTQSRLNIIQRNGYRLLRMVDQLLNLETFRVKSITQKTPQAFGESIKLIAEAFADIAKEKAIKFSVGQIDSVYFEFTPDALEKIVLNLLSNAIKYTPENGSIKIEAKRTHENHYVITVTDSGIGIAKEQHDKIFERFNRVIDEQSEQITGAGIGLALVKSLVEAHQGSIQLNSKLGQGTEIKINLPIINEVDKEQVSTHHSDEIIALELMSLSAQRHMVDGSQDSQQDTNNQSTVLIIEDNTDMRNYIADSIRSEYHVITAKNGKEGVDIALREVPDLIISDIMMPLMDGYQVAHSLRENDITNHIPIVLLTARGDKKSRLKGWQEKADEYLTKPFDDEELKIRLANLLAIRNILKKRFGEVVFTEQPSTTDSEEDDLEKLKSDQQQAFLQKLNQVIDQVYADPKIAIIDIAKSLAMSDRQLSRKLKSITDLTPVEYLRRYRLEQGKILLRQGMPSTIVAHDVGFSSQSYFGKCFKAQFGVSPSEFLKK